MAGFENYDDLVLAQGPVPLDALSPKVQQGLRAAGYIQLIRDGDREFEGYRPEQAEEHTGWLHAMDEPTRFCGSEDSEGPWDVGEQGANIRLASWGEPRGTWDTDALTWSVDPTGCTLTPADVLAACRQAFGDWQVALSSLVGGGPAVNLTEAAAFADASIKVRFGDKSLNAKFGTPGGVLAVGYYPSSQSRGSLHVDSTETWSGAGDLAGVLRHEIGHVLGLAHSDVPGTLMYPYATSPVIDADTRLAARLLYGFPQQTRLSDRGSVASPAACSDGATVYAAWRGIDHDQLLYLAEFTSVWSAQTKAVGGSSHGPGVAWHGGQLWLAWKGMGDDQRLFVSHHTRGVGWAPQLALPGKGTAASPALATFGGDLYLFWRGIHDDQTLYWSMLDGGEWSEQRRIAGAGSSHGPAAIEHAGRLWVIWKGIEDDAAIFTTSVGSGANDIWEAPTRMSWTDNQTDGRVRRYPGTTAEPCFFRRSGQLWAVWRGIEKDPNLYCSRLDPTGWAGQIRLPGGSAQGPAAAEAGRGTVFLWRGINGDATLYSAGW